MLTSVRSFDVLSRDNLQRAAFVVTMVAGLALAMATPAYAQTYTILHDFTGEADGGVPESSPLVDAGGNLYGTTSMGGIGNGVVYKLTHRASGWMFTRLYIFLGGMDGASPVGGLVFGPDGALYGTTAYGGGGPCTSGIGFQGCGTVFRLTPPPTACPATSCPWTETVLYRFQSFGDAAYPWSGLTFDPAGNIYGTTFQGGSHSNGTVYELTRTNGSWSGSVLHSFDGLDGYGPHREVIFDAAGNLYGTAYQGGANDCGVVFKLSPTQSGWVETVIYNAVCWPGPQYILGGVTFGSPNTLFGSSVNGGQPNGGTVFKLSLANGVWNESTLYTLQESAEGPIGTPVLDQAGNIYETTSNQGLGCGSVFKLTNSSGNWLFSDLHDFNNTDGCYPSGDVHLDRSGNMFGATEMGGNSICFPGGGGCGIIWQISP